MISTRRFWARPSAVSLSAIGSCSPRPSTAKPRRVADQRPRAASATALARATERSKFDLKRAGGRRLHVVGMADDVDRARAPCSSALAMRAAIGSNSAFTSALPLSNSSTLLTLMTIIVADAVDRDAAGRDLGRERARGCARAGSRRARICDLRRLEGGALEGDRRRRVERDQPVGERDRHCCREECGARRRRRRRTAAAAAPIAHIGMREVRSRILSSSPRQRGEMSSSLRCWRWRSVS